MMALSAYLTHFPSVFFLHHHIIFLPILNSLPIGTWHCKTKYRCTSERDILWSLGSIILVLLEFPTSLKTYDFACEYDLREGVEGGRQWNGEDSPQLIDNYKIDISFNALTSLSNSFSTPRDGNFHFEPGSCPLALNISTHGPPWYSFLNILLILMRGWAGLTLHWKLKGLFVSLSGEEEFYKSVISVVMTTAH